MNASGSNRLRQGIWQFLRSKLAKSASIYLLSYAVSLGVPFLLLPIMTKYIDPDGYGHLAILQMLLFVSSVFILFALRRPLIQAASVGNEEDLAGFLSASLWVIMGMFVITLSVMLLFHTGLSRFTGLSVRWIAVIVVGALGFAINQLNLAAMQATHRPSVYAATQIGFSLLSLVAAVFLVVALHTGWSGRGVAILVVAMFSGLWGILRFMEAGLIRKVSWNQVWHVLSFGASAMPHSLSMTVQLYSDRILLGLLFTFSDIGIYTVAAHMAQGFVACSEAVNLALEPWIYRRLEAAGNRIAISNIINIAFLLIGCVAVTGAAYYFTMGLLGRFLLPPNYAQAFAYFAWLLPAACCQGLFNIFAAVLFHYQHKRALSLLGVFTLCSAILLISIFAHLYGTIGIAMGILCNRVLLLVLVIGVALFLLRNPSPTRPTAQNALIV